MILKAMPAIVLVCLSVHAAIGQDPLKVAPDSYKLEFENEYVRVQRVHYAPHARIPEHDHTAFGAAYVYLDDAGPVIFKHVGLSYGAVTRPAVKAGSFRLYKAVRETHEVENPSSTASDFMRVEFKTEPDRNANTLRGKFFHEDVAAGENSTKVQFENEQVRITRLVCAAVRKCEFEARAGEPSLFVALSAARIIPAVGAPIRFEPGQTRWLEAGAKEQWEGEGRGAAEMLRFDLKTAPLKSETAEAAHPHPSPASPGPEELARRAEASELLKRGAALESAGRIEESIAVHLQALGINPRLVQAHINLITLYGRRREPGKAEEHYRAAIELNPDLADIHYNYGVLLAGQERSGEAAQAFRRCLELDPYYAKAHHNYAAIIEREGKLDEAAKHYLKAIENRPGYRLAHFHLGRILVNQGKTSEAIEQFQQTLAPEDGETPRFMYALGATYIRAGDKARGVEYLREALKRALALNQPQIANSIERDLKALGEGR